MVDLPARVASLELRAVESEIVSDNTWVLNGALIVLTMQAGFAMLETGCVGSKNCANMYVRLLMKNLVDVNAGCIAFWLVGYGLAYGDGGDVDAFMGMSQFGLSGTQPSQFPHFFFNFAFASTAATILSGAVCGRMKYHSYIIASTVVTAVVYPIPAHWVWSPSGWLAQLGFVDFAGDGPVHLVGGLVGLMTTWKLGPRIGVFSEPSGQYLPLRSSPSSVLLGVFLLWWGWFGFNSGSTGSVSNGNDVLAARVAINTGLAAGGGTIAALLFSSLVHRGRWVCIYESVTGTLAGLVAVTAAPHAVRPAEAATMGAVGGVLANLASYGLVRLRIDDPVAVVPVHVVSAAWGLLAAGLFVGNDPVWGEPQLGRLGLFHGGGFELLGIQVLGVLALTVWSLGATALLLACVSLCTGGLRVSRQVETDGLDASEHNLLTIRTVVTEEGAGTPLSRVQSRRNFGGKSFLFRSDGAGLVTPEDVASSMQQSRSEQPTSSATIAPDPVGAQTRATVGGCSVRAFRRVSIDAQPSFLTTKSFGGRRVSDLMVPATAPFSVGPHATSGSHMRARGGGGGLGFRVNLGPSGDSPMSLDSADSVYQVGSPPFGPGSRGAGLFDSSSGRNRWRRGGHSGATAPPASASARFTAEEAAEPQTASAGGPPAAGQWLRRGRLGTIRSGSYYNPSTMSAGASSRSMALSVDTSPPGSTPTAGEVRREEAGRLHAAGEDTVVWDSDCHAAAPRRLPPLATAEPEGKSSPAPADGTNSKCKLDSETSCSA